MSASCTNNNKIKIIIFTKTHFSQQQKTYICIYIHCASNCTGPRCLTTALVDNSTGTCCTLQWYLHSLHEGWSMQTCLSAGTDWLNPICHWQGGKWSTVQPFCRHTLYPNRTLIPDRVQRKWSGRHQLYLSRQCTRIVFRNSFFLSRQCAEKMCRHYLYLSRQCAKKVCRHYLYRSRQCAKKCADIIISFQIVCKESADIIYIFPQQGDGHSLCKAAHPHPHENVYSMALLFHSVNSLIL